MCGSCIAQRIERLSGFDYYDIYHGSKYGDKVGALECELSQARESNTTTPCDAARERDNQNG